MKREPVNGTASDPALLMARQTLYRFAALSLLDPRAGAWPRLNALRGGSPIAEAAALLRAEPAAEARPLDRGERPLADLDPSPLLALLPDSAAGSNEQFERTFGLLVCGPCPPYETEYVNSKFAFQRSQALGDIGGFYAAFGLQPSAANPERHDHIVLELEFMACLLGLERDASENGSAGRLEQAAVCRDAQARFLKEHLAWWVPTFARLLSKENPGGFYAAAGAFLAALVPAERALLGVDVVAGAAVGPSSVERPDECDGCVLQGAEGMASA